MNAFAGILPILKKEVQEILRDPYMLAISFVMPLVLLVLFAYGLNLDVDHIRTSVVDQDGSQQSYDYVRRFQNSGYFDVVQAPRRFSDAQAAMSRDVVKAIIVIPPQFGRRMLQAHSAPIQVIVDGSFPPAATVAIGYAQALGSVASTEQIASRFATEGQAFTPAIDIEPRVLYNPELRTKIFIVPGLLAVILLAFPPLLSSLSIVRERERGSLAQLRLSPVTPAAFITGKTIPYVVIAFIELLTIMAFGVFGFRVPFVGSITLYVVASLIYVAAAVGIGILISSITRSQIVAMLVSLIATLMPSFLFSGFLFPIYNMPRFFQWYSQLFPARYFIDISRGIWLKGNLIPELWIPLLTLAAYTVLILGAAIWRARSLVR